MQDESRPRVDTLLAAATIAHEVVFFDLNRELVKAGLAGETEKALLSESARIAAVEMPSLADGARELRALYDRERLLGSPSAERLADELAREEQRIEPHLERSLARLKEIATTMRDSLDRDDLGD